MSLHGLTLRQRQALRLLDNTRLRRIKKEGTKRERMMAYGLLVERRNDARQ